MEKLFKNTGFKTKDGKFILVDSGCGTCGGRGYIGRDIKRNILISCPKRSCLKTTKLPIEWVIL